MLGMDWWQVILAATAALAVLWRITRYIFKIDRALPVLLRLAVELENGTTIKERIDAVAESQKNQLQAVVDKLEAVVSLQQEQAIRSHWTVKIAEDSRLVAQTNAKIVEELTGAQTADIIELKNYLHDKIHDLNNAIGVAGLKSEITDKRSERIEKRLDDMLPYVIRRREGNGSPQ
jgi:hypothetical protein